MSHQDPTPQDPLPENQDGVPQPSHPVELSVDPDMKKVLSQLEALGGPGFSEMTPKEARSFSETFANPAPTIYSVEHVRDLQIPGPEGDIPARLYHPCPGTPCPVVVAFHGGGWVLGSIDSYDDECRMMSKMANVAVLSVGYRLAPEHPYPAAVTDAFAALCWAYEHSTEIEIDPTRIAVAGSSAGANLAAVCTLLARDQGYPSIRFQLLVYPVTDADFERPTMHAFEKGFLLEREDMIWFWNHYCPTLSDREDFKACPLRAKTLVGLPPAYLALASLDPLLEEGLDYGTRLQKEGVRCTIRVSRGFIHGFFQMTASCPAALSEIELAYAALATELHR